MTLNQHKIEKYVIIACLKSETVGKLINRIPSSRLLISSLPDSALRTLVESLGKPREASRCQQAFSKPCLVNLISKDTHLVFSICHERGQYATMQLIREVTDNLQIKYNRAEHSL